jgi:uncharacterized protein (TIGR03437 family)
MFYTIAVVAGLSYYAAPGKLAAASPATTAPNVTYTASGTFAATPTSGNDLFKLAGQPFSITVVANEALAPAKHGATWAQYTKLKMTGTVQSGLLPTPTALSSSSTGMELATGNPKYDVFGLGSALKVVGLQISITATIDMPIGTITNDHILPFTAPVTLSPANATFVYKDSTDSTTLGLNGTLTATIAAAHVTPAMSAVMLHAAGAQSVIQHPDGTLSIRSINGVPIETGSPADRVALQFFASGVSGASDIHMQIAGEEVPVLFAGPSNHFPGLDQVTVQLPASMAWRGAVDAIMTVDGRQAEPVHIQIQ